MARKPRKNPKWFDDYVQEDVVHSSLFQFTIETADKQKIDVDMVADLDIDYDILRDQLEDTPAIYAYWSAMYSEMKMQTALLERRIKAKRGKLIDAAVKEAARADVRITQKSLEMIIESDETLNKLEIRLLLMQKHAGKMFAMIQAIQMKSDNLRSLAGFARQELSQA